MHKTDAIGGGVFAAVGAAFVVGALQLGVGSATSDGVMGPGFFPFLLEMLVVILSLALVISYFRHQGEKTESFRMEVEQRDNLKPLVLTVVCLLGLFVLWHLLNQLVPSYCFEIAAVLFCLVLNRIYRRGWLFTVAYSVVIVTVVHFVFVRVLYIQFSL